MIRFPLRRAAIFRSCVCFALGIAACTAIQAKPLRGDVVTMKNGDRFTGEVKRLQSGVLYIETDYSSSNLAVDWTQVQNVKSTAMYLITLSNGVHVTGKLERLPGTDEHGEDVTILNDDRALHLPPAQVIE